LHKYALHIILVQVDTYLTFVTDEFMQAVIPRCRGFIVATADSLGSSVIIKFNNSNAVVTFPTLS